MSFIGAVHSSVRKVLAGYAAEIDLPVLLIGAGNFTVASVLRSGGYQGPITGCDVSLYTSALGAYLSDQPIVLKEREDCPEQLRGLLRLDSPEEMVASIALLYDLRDSWQMKNPFQERMVVQYRKKWEELLKKTGEKLAAYKQHLGKVDYQARDGFDLLEKADPAHTVFAFPPTYKRGYERLEKLLRAAIAWEPPPYREMTDKSLDLFRLVARFDSYFVVLEKDLPEVHAILGKPSAVMPRGRSGFSHIITRRTSRRIVLRQQAKSRDIGPFWPADRRITGNETLSVRPITLAQSIRMNELFLSARINYFTGGVGLSLAFLLDGMIFGKADFCPSSHQWKLPQERPMIYVMCDLAIPSVEPRLAKLVLLCMQSAEVKRMLDLRYLENFGWLCTTAFSRHPASMKYRGIFTLHKRKEEVGGWSLNYYAPFSGHALTQVLGIYGKKYGKTGK